MGTIVNGGKRAYGGNGALRDQFTPEQKKTIANKNQQIKIKSELEKLFPRIKVLDISNFLTNFMPGCLRACNSVDGLNGLKKFLYDNESCKNWLKENVGLNGHIPGSWGRIALVGTGKVQIGPKIKNASRKKIQLRRNGKA
jgi:hypothetical protein